MHEVPAVTRQQWEGLPGLVRVRFAEGEAHGRGAVDGGQVVVVGLVVGVGRLAEALAGEGMHDAGLEVGPPKGIADGVMIPAGVFAGHQDVAPVVRLARLPYLVGQGVELDAVMRHPGRWREGLAVEVSRQRLTACLGTIDTNDAKMLLCELLDPRLNAAPGLVK